MNPFVEEHDTKVKNITGKNNEIEAFLATFHVGTRKLSSVKRKREK